MLNPNLTEIELSKDEYQRYSRHIILPEVGLDGQKRLKAASVLCVGTGGLGSPLLLYLARLESVGLALLILILLTVPTYSVRSFTELPGR